MTGELADGWLGTSFIPEHADVFFVPLNKGLAKSGRTLSEMDIQVGASFEVSDDVDAMVSARKPAMAFTLGGMGSEQSNFYNDAFKRAGYEEAAINVQKLWVTGKKEEAIRARRDGAQDQSYRNGDNDLRTLTRLSRCRRDHVEAQHLRIVLESALREPGTGS
jgi:alkanesulfonate monooxygenase SsuD/methylene tetrahydromethanopterin reductase-like flavin-dependent oxidoreductase (luciferase family)